MRKTLTRLFMAVLMVTLLVGASIMSVSAETSCDVADHTAQASHINVNTMSTTDGIYVLDQADTTYYLSDKVTTQIKVTATDVTLCMNGYSIETGAISLNVTGEVNVVNGSDTVSNILTTADTRAIAVGAGSGSTAKVTINAGISVSDSTSVQEAVFLNGGTFVMNEGATITGNTGTAAGGVRIHNGGTFTMNGGTISGNTASGVAGGGVNVLNGTFEMKGGTITGNTATNGGGVYVQAGSFTMSGDAAITNNTTQGVYVVNSAAFTMNGGSITGNTKGTADASAVYLSGTSTMTMTAGTISGEANAMRFGTTGNVTLSGGTITGTNNLSIFNGGAAVTMSGTVEVTTGGVTNHTGTLTIEGGTFGSNVNANNTSTTTISGGSFAGAVTKGADTATLSITGGKFATKPADALLASGYVANPNTDTDSDIYGYVVEKPTHDCGLNPDVDAAQWKAITTADGYTIDADGYYYLATNMTGQIYVTSGKTATLCMCGYSIDTENTTASVYVDGTITVVNCDDEDESEIVGSASRGIYVTTKGKATIGSNVTVTGGSSAVFILGDASNKGELVVAGGTLLGTDKDSDGVVYANTGKVTLESGSIKVGATDGTGAIAVKLATRSGYTNPSELSMTGGTIDGGTGKSINNTSAGTVTISNGTITGEFYTGTGAAGGTLTISGSAVINSQLTYDGGTLTIDGGTFNGGVTVRASASGTISGGTFAGTVATGTNGTTGTLTIKGGSFAGAVSEAASDTVTIIGGQFSDKNDMAVLRGFVGVDSDNAERMLSVIDMGTATYRYKVAESYAYDGEHMDYKSSLALSIYLGSDNGKLVTDTTGITVTAKSATGKEYEPTMTYDSTAGKMLLTASGIAAKEIHDKITFTVTTEGGDVLFSKTMSVYDAAAEAKAAKQAEDGDATTIANHIAMLEDVVNYGIAAQKEFGYTVGDTLGTGSTNAWTEKTGDSDKTWNDGEVAISLFLEERIELNFYLKGEGVADLELTSDVDHTVDREYGEGAIRVTFDNIDVVDAMDPVTLNVGDKYITCSIVDYVLTNTSQLDLMSALAKYVQSVYNVLSDAQ